MTKTRRGRRKVAVSIEWTERAIAEEAFPADRRRTLQGRSALECLRAGHQARLEVHADGTVEWEGYAAKAARVGLDRTGGQLRVELSPGTRATKGASSVTLEGTLVTGPCAP